MSTIQWPGTLLQNLLFTVLPPSGPWMSWNKRLLSTGVPSEAMRTCTCRNVRVGFRVTVSPGLNMRIGWNSTKGKVYKSGKRVLELTAAVAE